MGCGPRPGFRLLRLRSGVPPSEVPPSGVPPSGDVAGDGAPASDVPSGDVAPSGREPSSGDVTGDGAPANGEAQGAEAIATCEAEDDILACLAWACGSHLKQYQRGPPVHLRLWREIVGKEEIADLMKAYAAAKSIEQKNTKVQMPRAPGRTNIVTDVRNCRTGWRSARALTNGFRHQRACLRRKRNDSG